MNSASKTALAWAGALALAATATTTQAAGLVTNGDFETGTFSGWTQTGNTDSSGVDGSIAHGGNFGAFFGPESTGGITQTLSTVAGTSYRVDFWLELDDSAIPSTFGWSWGGTAQTPSFTNVAGFNYTEFTSIVTATGASTALAFNFANPNSFWLLDDVSVTAVTAPVPEPETYAMMLGGLALLLGRRRLARRER